VNTRKLKGITTFPDLISSAHNKGISQTKEGYSQKCDAIVEQTEFLSHTEKLETNPQKSEVRQIVLDKKKGWGGNTCKEASPNYIWEV